ncbi:MAG: phosphotransferase [bacterium]|nr:phosphotransferase [bacterium]
MDSTPAIPAGSAEVTPGWVRQAFAAGGRADIPTVEDVDVEQVGVGIGHVGESLRCRLTYAGDAPAAPATVVVKLHSSHPETDKLARRVRLYRRECAFYQLLSHHAPIRSPILYYGDYERRSNRLVLVLEDLGGMGRVDEIEGANSEQAMSVVRAIARFHAYSWNKTGTAPYIDIFDSLDPKWRPPVQLIYLASLRRTFEVFGDHFSQHMQRITETLGWRAADYMGDLATGPRAFGHGDYRLDNMFFGPGPDDLAVIDWQVCGGNNPLGDVAYFLGGSLPVEVRRSIERGAIAEYHDTLGREGVEGIGLEDCWRLYRQNMFVRMLVIVISAGGLDISNERSVRLLGLGLDRTLAALEDLEAEEFLPDRRRLFGPSWAFSTASRCAYGASKRLRKS